MATMAPLTAAEKLAEDVANAKAQAAAMAVSELANCVSSLATAMQRHLSDLNGRDRAAFFHGWMNEQILRLQQCAVQARDAVEEARRHY